MLQKSVADFPPNKIQCIFFCVQNKKESQTGLEEVQGKKFFWGELFFKAVFKAKKGVQPRSP